jgi:hypothetical protein
MITDKSRMPVLRRIVSFARKFLECNIFCNDLKLSQLDEARVFPLPTISPARALHVQVPEQLYIELDHPLGGLAFLPAAASREPDGDKDGTDDCA